MKVSFRAITPTKDGRERTTEFEVELLKTTKLQTLDFLAMRNPGPLVMCTSVELAIPPGGRIEIEAV
jgi:hypothetical protein